MSRYSFLDWLKHYMEGNQITEGNCTSVKLCIFVEAGVVVCGIDPMKKDKKEPVFFSSTWQFLI